MLRNDKYCLGGQESAGLHCIRKSRKCSSRSFAHKIY